MNVQPWAFAVIQDKELLQKISDESKVYLLASISERPYL
ncbi:MAG: nitroreductase family protein, partial [Acidaminococcaceae bacterium]